MASTYKLILEYEGGRYRGWQDQQNAPRTVMGVLRRALEEAGAEVVDLGGAGRTDAGVHALAQVAHLRLAKPRDPARLRDEINAGLPADVHVLALVPASERFHARHSAISRSYVYQISRRRTAFAKPFVWWVREGLDVEAMRAAAALFVGRHDYAAFSAAPEGPKSTLVEVEAVEVAEAGSLVLVRVVASHFLWKMVRRMIGTLVRVGGGQLAPARVAALLAGEKVPAADDPARFTAPPSGLFLERVRYEGDPPLGPLRPAIAVDPEPTLAPPRAEARSRPPAAGKRPAGKPPAAPRPPASVRPPSARSPWPDRPPERSGRAVPEGTARRAPTARIRGSKTRAPDEDGDADR